MRYALCHNLYEAAQIHQTMHHLENDANVAVASNVIINQSINHQSEKGEEHAEHQLKSSLPAETIFMLKTILLQRVILVLHARKHAWTHTNMPESSCDYKLKAMDIILCTVQKLCRTLKKSIYCLGVPESRPTSISGRSSSLSRLLLQLISTPHWRLPSLRFSIQSLAKLIASSWFCRTILTTQPSAP